MKDGECYEFRMRIKVGEFNFEKWFDDRWMHEPLFHVPGYSQYLAFDNIMKLEHGEYHDKQKHYKRLDKLTVIEGHDVVVDAIVAEGNNGWGY